ncbi:Lrp/AsnC family transcriptional regulator [Salinicoccus halitifaciens]|uniref:Lrp/AsnC family leucine-responsive transcriptional regulator n=1 Tax=Salinicoccus halitifaciens TaxID=1073415 RepID=A0ABV2E8W7_9STAP|nr:winged helix-turn-helix transcriptional regulator [Salinicoccus halitifaciens]MCD2137987.1 winged helix-turn-helix transcriptional regulator [Salinicoccus halitifaciens]
MIDHTDQEILAILSENSRISMKELGERVHLTGAAAAACVMKLLDNGVITSCSIEVNQMKIGYPVHAFINIMIPGITHQNYLEFLDEYPQFVINNYKVSGEGCYLLESRFPSNEVMDQFLTDLNKYANYKLSIVIGK